MQCWQSYDDFFKKLNQQEYLILRNYEKLIKEIENGGDIDILCKNKADLVKEIYAVPLNSNRECFNYYVMIKNRKILLDIRNVGDGYYDEVWESVMLKCRIPYEYFYVMDEFNYKYSLLYHVIIHKHEISEQYLQKLSCYFGEEIRNKKIRIKELCQFLKQNTYRLTKPVDLGVSINKKNFLILAWQMKCRFY